MEVLTGRVIPVPPHPSPYKLVAFREKAAIAPASETIGFFFPLDGILFSIVTNHLGDRRKLGVAHIIEIKDNTDI
jgi:hypothetical protein